MSDPFITYWKQQQTLRRHQNQQAADLARRDVAQLEELLRKHYGVQCIILFGSLIKKGQFTVESDIDLVVAGLAPEDFFTAYAEVNQYSQFKVDLKPLEGLHPHFCDRIFTQGEILYEAPDFSRT